MLGKGRTAELIRIENEGLKRAYEEIVKERDYLRDRIRVLEEALIATKSPQAYTQMVHDRVELANPNPGSHSRISQEQEIYQKYISQIEQPLFKDVQDMEDALQTVLNVPQSESVHENTES